MGSDEQSELKEKYREGKGDRHNNNFLWRNALLRVQIIKREGRRQNSRDWEGNPQPSLRTVDFWENCRLISWGRGKYFLEGSHEEWMRGKVERRDVREYEVRKSVSPVLPSWQWDGSDHTLSINPHWFGVLIRRLSNVRRLLPGMIQVICDLAEGGLCLWLAVFWWIS